MMEQMREAVARALREHMIRAGVVKSWMEYADAALSLMQPEIDRRVAEEKAKLLERLREPSEAMISAGYLSIYDTSGDTTPEEVWRGMLANFKGNDPKQNSSLMQDLISLVVQYRSDLKRPPKGDSLERRLARIDEVLAQYEKDNNHEQG